MLFTLITSAHGCKNFKKKLETLGKTYPEIKAVAIRCSKAMANIIVSSHGNNRLFLNLIEKKMSHYCNDHRHCADAAKCNKTAVVINAKAQKLFKVGFIFII